MPFLPCRFHLRASLLLRVIPVHLNRIHSWTQMDLVLAKAEVQRKSLNFMISAVILVSDAAGSTLRAQMALVLARAESANAPILDSCPPPYRHTSTPLSNAILYLRI